MGDRKAMKRFKFLTILAVIFLCGCTEVLNDCEVVGKEYIPASQILQMQQFGRGFVMLPINKPERYELTLRGWNAEGISGVGTVKVDSTTYHKTEIGDQWEKSIEVFR